MVKTTKKPLHVYLRTDPLDALRALAKMRGESVAGPARLLLYSEGTFMEIRQAPQFIQSLQGGSTIIFQELQSIKFIFIQHLKMSIREDEQVEREILGIDMSILDDRRSGDVAVPALVLLPFPIVNREDVIPAVLVESFHEKVATF